MADVKISDLTDGTAVATGDLVEIERPGTPNVSRRVPLGTAAGANEGDFATAAQGGLADSAVQPGDLATVATSGDYGDLTNKPTLGTAASADTGDFAAASHGHTLSDISDAGDSAGLDVGATAGTVAAGDDSRITGAVQKDGTGQDLTGEYRHAVHNYGNLGSSTITLNPANGLTGKITRNSGSGTIAAPSGTPSGIYNMIIFIDGTSSTGSPSLSGFTNTDFGGDMPGSAQHAWLYVTCGPDAKTAKIEAIDY